VQLRFLGEHGFLFMVGGLHATDQSESYSDDRVWLSVSHPFVRVLEYSARLRSNGYSKLSDGRPYRDSFVTDPV
jgi:hypothetical protein